MFNQQNHTVVISEFQDQQKKRNAQFKGLIKEVNSHKNQFKGLKNELATALNEFQNKLEDYKGLKNEMTNDFSDT